MSWVYGTDTDAKLVVTAGSGEFADGVVVVTDASGNASTTTTHKVTIDNTAPTNITLTAGGSNHDQAADQHGPCADNAFTKAGDNPLTE